MAVGVMGRLRGQVQQRGIRDAAGQGTDGGGEGDRLFNGLVCRHEWW